MGFNLSSIWYTRRLTWFQIMKCRNLDINPKFKLILTAIRATYSCQWVVICRSDQFEVNQRPFIPRTQLQRKLRVNTLISKNVVGENGKWQLSNGNCTTKRNCGLHIWYAKTMSFSRGAKLANWRFTRNLEISRSTVLSETPKKNEASATEFWRIWTNHMIRHRRSALHEAGIMGDYLLLIFNTHISFQSYNRRSTTDIRRSPLQHFFK